MRRGEKKREKEKKTAEDSPDGDSLAFSLHGECDACMRACVCVCVSSAIHHPICQQRQSSALSHTKNWLRAPLIGLNVAAILP